MSSQILYGSLLHIKFYTEVLPKMWGKERNEGYKHTPKTIIEELCKMNQSHQRAFMKKSITSPTMKFSGVKED